MPSADPSDDPFVRLCRDLRVLFSLWARAARGTTTDDRFAARLFYGLLARRIPCFRPLPIPHTSPVRTAAVDRCARRAANASSPSFEAAARRG